jgi:hypothetical protein
MIVYREFDYAHYLFDGKWPIPIGPHSEPWGEQYAEKKEVKEQIIATEQDLPMLNDILASKKKLFTVSKKRYQIIYRGTFISE